MIKFIHTADIHLDSPLKGLEIHDDAPVDDIRGATRRAFDNLVELAVEEDVDFILIAGDLYDGDWKDYNTGLFFVSRMGRLSRAGIRVFIVSGNHDAASQITKAMPLPDNVTVFGHGKPHSVTLDDLGVIIHGQSYGFRAVTDNLAAQYPFCDAHYFNIGMLHTSLTGREGHESYAPCSLDDLKSKGYDYWALGHIHRRETVSTDPWMVFSGNPQGRHIRETGPKGVNVVTVEDGRVTEVLFHELDVLRWGHCLVDLSECDTPEIVHDTVRQAFEQERDLADGRPLALRLELTGACPVHGLLLEGIIPWTEEFRGIAATFGDVWLEKVKFRTCRKLNSNSSKGATAPILGLVHAIEQLKLDQELDKDSLSDLVPEVAVLKTKLPAEIYADAEDFLDSSTHNVSALCREVQEILIARLLAHGDGR
ncbi:metallophosphoesterase family protein [Desulfocicer niacini]